MMSEEESITRRGDIMPERSREKVVKLVQSWNGKNERDGSHKEIIDIYNSLGKENLPRKLLMQYDWSWCAATWSALAIKLGYTDIMPIEMSCGYLIDLAEKMGCWVENDKYVPKPGDAVLYDWDDSGKGDNIGWPDHIGTVEEVYPNSGYFVVMEGNYQDSVKRRTVSINGRYIRGFITPAYTTDGSIEPERLPGKDLKTVVHEVIAGKWGNGEERKEALRSHGYDPEMIQKEVNRILNGDAYIPVTKPSEDQPFTNRVTRTCYATNRNTDFQKNFKTTANLYCRNDAGSNKKALCVIPEGTTVRCYGYYSVSNGIKWPLIQVVLDKTLFTGFCCSNYLK